MSLAKALNYLDSHWLDDQDAFFPICLILNSLNSCSLLSSKQLKKRISKLLIKQKSSVQTFNYWFHNSKRVVEESYPDDLDDTFCAWTSIFNFDPKMVDQALLLDLSKILLSSQVKVGGPYFTWLATKDSRQKWSEVDFVVNLNVARFLASQKITVTGLNEYIELKIESENFSSIFYKGELASLYFLSYFYNGQHRAIIKKKLIYYLSKDIHDSSIILIFIAVIRFGFENLLTSNHLKIISMLQNKDGSVNPFDLYLYKNPKSNQTYYSSKALSTAFLVELLSLLEASGTKKKFEQMRLTLLEIFKQRVAIIDSSVVTSKLLLMAEKIVRSEVSDFALFLPQHLVSSFKKPALIDKKEILLLSLVNLFSWISYTIYDNVNDREGDSDKLPFANLSFQFLLKEVLNLRSGRKHLHKILNLFRFMELNFIEEFNSYRFRKNPWANISKLSPAKIKNFTYKKAIGQIFSVDVILNRITSTKTDRKYILEVLRNLILIKQMNDDLHDCFEDLQKGQINSANYFLLKQIEFNQEREQLLKEKLSDLRVIFYQETIPVVCDMINCYIKKSRFLLNKQKMLKKDNYFKIILSSYEKIVQEGLRERDGLIKYLD